MRRGDVLGLRKALQAADRQGLYGVDPDGRTALEIAITLRRQDIVLLLLNSGAPVTPKAINAADAAGYEIFRKIMEGETAKQRRDIVSKLPAADIKEQKAKTMDEACADGNIGAVKDFIAKGEPLRPKHLEVATRHGHRALLGILLHRYSGESEDGVKDLLHRLLTLASERGHMDIVDLLARRTYGTTEGKPGKEKKEGMIRTEKVKHTSNRER